METDFNLKTDTCFDDEPENTDSLKELQKTAFLQRVEQEFNDNSLVKRKGIKVRIVTNALFADGYQIRISPEDKKEKKKEKKLIFGCRKSIEILTILLLRLDKEIPLFFDRSQVHVFANMLISKDLSQFHEQLHLKCLSTEFKCVMEHLSLYCKSFNPTTIERSNAFISSCGTLINASYLYNTSTEHLHNKELIADIFKKYC